MALYLVRHGLAAAGVDDLDPGLADLGHAQAEATARALAATSAGRLVVSPLRRTRETADPVARALGLVPEIREEVGEVFDPAMSPEERRAMIRPFMAGHWSEQSDVLRAWRRRVLEALTEFGAGTAMDVIVVSHYIAIGVAIGEALGDDRVVPVPIPNCSITAVDVDETSGRLVLKEAAAVGHLAPEQVTGAGEALPGGPPRAG